MQADAGFLNHVRRPAGQAASDPGRAGPPLPPPLAQAFRMEAGPLRKLDWGLWRFQLNKGVIIERIGCYTNLWMLRHCAVVQLMVSQKSRLEIFIFTLLFTPDELPSQSGHVKLVQSWFEMAHGQWQVQLLNEWWEDYGCTGVIEYS